MGDPSDIAATLRQCRAFAEEQPWRTWAEVLPTLALLALLQTALLAPLPIGLRALLVVPFALLLVRGFAFYHDMLHGAIFRESRIGRALVTLLGLYFIYSPSIWRARHNAHHRHNSMTDAREVDGQIPMLTLDCWRELPESKRRLYRRFRAPLTVATGYFGYFIVPCWLSLRRDPRAHRDGIVWLAVQPLVLITLGLVFDVPTALVGFFAPVFVAAAIGSYLFYAQHSFDGARYQRKADWNYHFAIFHTTSQFDMPRWMQWCCGNLGYHHVHHANVRIPFYRLAEATAAIPGLAHAPRTNWRARTIRRVFALHLWDDDAQELIGYAEAAKRCATASR
jgi:omega-6 fatty acid desaturase (delta-12 desaturase)